jgi:tetratricopeptide (TPR) repeat protein
VDDATALYWNPAVLGRLRQSEAGFMHSSFGQEIAQDAVYLTQPTVSFGTFGVGLSSLRAGGIAGYSATGLRSADYSSADTLGTLAWGRSLEGVPVVSGLSAGLSVKYLQKRIDGFSGTATLGDAGLHYLVPAGWVRGLRLGAMVQNVTEGEVTLDRQASKLGRVIRAGVSYPLLGDSLVLATDWVAPAEGDAFAALGADYRLWDVLAFRVGWRGGNDLGSGVSYGLRFGTDRLHVDYALVPTDAVGEAHRVSVGLRFGRSRGRKQITSQVQAAFERAESLYAQGYLVDSYMAASEILASAPWFRPAKDLMSRIQDEVKIVGDESRSLQIKVQLDDHFNRGELMYQTDNLLGARKEFKTILELEPTHVASQNYLNRIEERLETVKRGFYDAAMRLMAGQNDEAAKGYLEKALVLDPDYIEAAAALKAVNQRIEESQLAAKQRETEAQVRPRMAAGIEFFNAKRYEEALGKFNEVLSLDPAHKEAKDYFRRSGAAATGLYRGVAQKAETDGDWSKAMDNWRMVLRFRPGDTEALAGAERARRKWDETRRLDAQKLYREALDALLRDDLETAEKAAREAEKLDPSNQEVQRILDRIRQKRGGL